MSSNARPDNNESPARGTHESLAEIYRSGDVPWDDPLPPPEIRAEVDALTAANGPGRALDLGCGFGRASIYLAERGWAVDAIDFVAEAIAEAERRATAAGVAVNFHQADVTRLDFLDPAYDFALDVGCAHSLDAPALARYATGLRRLLRPGARYMLFARRRPDRAESEEANPRGLDEAALRTAMADGFTLERVDYGETVMDEADSWASAWFWFRRD